MLDADGTDSLQAVQYYNGLGYPTLAVANANAQGGTAYTLTTYDGCGREKRKYAPAPGTSLDYITESSMQNMGNVFYQDNYAFTQKHLDALDRVTAVDIAGYRWRNAGKQDRTEYGSNSSEDHVLHYAASVGDSDGGLVLPESTSFLYYPSGALSKVTSYDADDKSVTVFSDMLGRKILERSAAGDTYYVYDNLGQLRFVLPPECQNSDDHTIFAYEYRYDNRGRITKKILPQAGTTQYWYDKADRVAYMKDPALGSRYRFYLYDRFGRLCVQGTCSGRTSSESTLSSTAFMAGTNGICMTGYTVPYTISNPELEIVNYYDNYDFIGENFLDRMPTVNISDTQRQYARGFLTGTVVYATNGEALGSISVYDQKGQVVSSVRKGLGGFVENVSTGYTFTGTVDNTMASVNVGYGSNFLAQTSYTYSCGRKTGMSQSVSHGLTTQARATSYTYDFAGRLSRKDRQTSGTSKSYCSYTYDVHGWLTSISSGAFQEQLHYADGLDGNCYNGNISTMKWRNGTNDSYQGYNLKYDDCNRLYNAVYGSGNDLTGQRNYFSEYAEYDGNGNITKLQRGGLVNKMYGGFGLVDNLTMTYDGNKLVSVRDDASRHAYVGATDFDGVPHQEYALAYNESGSLVSDEGRNIANIEYDNLNNPVRIQFTNGNVTKYVYSAAGEKLRVIYQTAVPNITVATGSTRELTPSETLYTDSIDYLLGGALTLRNGRIDKFLFDEGYCQAEAYTSTKDDFTFCYYDKDHLGNVRQVTELDGTSKGSVIQRNNYYPFGAEFCDNLAKSYVQRHKYNGKEFDNMHGLNTYDYGARQYNPVTARWDRVDPLAHEYYGISPYVYCMNNPVKYIDINGLFATKNEAVKYAEERKIELRNVHYANDKSEWFVALGEDEKGYKSGGTLTRDFGPDQVVRGAMSTVNTTVGGASTYTTYSGKYYKWNEVWHQTKTAGTSFRWQSRWNKHFSEVNREKQIASVAHARRLSNKLTKVGKVLVATDIVLSGEIKPSHIVNGLMLGASLTGVGSLVSGIWFMADSGAMGINYLITGEADGLGDMLDKSTGTLKLYNGIY